MIRSRDGVEIDHPYIPIRFANGCFDAFHDGHRYFLSLLMSKAWMEMCADAIVVAVNSDESIRALKGEGRPLQPLAERMAHVQAFCGGRATVLSFDTEADLEQLCKRLRPVMYKSDEYKAGYTGSAWCVGTVWVPRVTELGSTTEVASRDAKESKPPIVGCLAGKGLKVPTKEEVEVPTKGTGSSDEAFVS